MGFGYAPPPPLPLPDFDGLSGGGGISYEEKQRLGEDIQGLGEDQLPGLFAIIQRHSNSAMVGDEEVELDLNSMSPQLLAEVRSYVDQIKN